MATIDRYRADRIGPPQLPVQSPQPHSQRADEGRQSFADHLKRAGEELGKPLSFSGHAIERAESRGIDLSVEQLDRIDKALDSVAAKGGRKALVMLDDLALIVGVDRRTVITMVNGDGLKENVFTAIDTAVIA